MDDLPAEETPRMRWFTILAGGCLVVLFLLLFTIAILFGYKQNAMRNSPTSTPTTVPTPRILVREPPDKSIVMHENFSSNKNNWGLFYPNGKLEVINGKLILQSNVKGGFAIGISNKFNPSNLKYYIQTDFSTDVDTAFSYGLVFGLNKSLTTYYMFEVWPQAASFRLFKYNAGKLTELIPFSHVDMSPYPQANTLSVYFDKGRIELFINGKSVSKYSDKDYFQSKDIGVFLSNTGYRLIVDDFFVYDEK